MPIQSSVRHDIIVTMALAMGPPLQNIASRGLENSFISSRSMEQLATFIHSISRLIQVCNGPLNLRRCELVANHKPVGKED